MVKLRPRKLPRALLPTSGSDQQGPSNADDSGHGAEDSCIVPSLQQSSQQVLGSFSDETVAVQKRARIKPKSRPPVDCVTDEINVKQMGLIKEIVPSVDLPAANLTCDNSFRRPARKRGKIVTSVDLPASDSTNYSILQSPPRKRGRKQKVEYLTDEINRQQIGLMKDNEKSVDLPAGDNSLPNPPRKRGRPTKSRPSAECVTDDEINRKQIGLMKDNEKSVDLPAGDSSLPNPPRKRGRPTKSRQPAACVTDDEINRQQIGLIKDIEKSVDLPASDNSLPNPPRKRGRPTKRRPPAECVTDEIYSQQIGLIKDIKKSVNLPAGDLTSNSSLPNPPRKRGRKPKCIGQNCCGQISCNNVPTVSRGQKLPKKKDQKPKCNKSDSEIIKTSERKKSVTAVLEEKSEVRIKSVRQRRVTVSNLSTKQIEVKKPCRKTKAWIQSDLSEPCVSEAIPSCSSKQGQEMGSTNDVKELGKNKRGGKPGPLNHKRLHDTQQLSSISSVSKEMKNKLPELSGDHQAEEESATTQLPCCKMELRNSRKTRKQEVPYSAESNALSSMQTCYHSCKLKTKGKYTDGITSQITCHAYARDVPNPIVRLENCKNLHKGPCTHTKTLAVESMSSVSDLSTQIKVSSENIVPSSNASLSALDKAENNDVFESSSNEKKPSRIPRLRRGFEAQKVNLHIERGDRCSSHSNSTTLKIRNEGTEFRVEQPDNVKLSCLQNDNLIEDTNNNNIIYENLKEKDEFSGQKTTKDSHTCSSQAPVSEEEISDTDCVDEKRSVSSSTAGCLDSPQTEETGNVSCQRIIPFSGKHIWKCSCARTCVWDFAHKGVSDSTEILGIKAERSLEIYSNYMPPLFESISEESIQDRTEQINSDLENKKRKLCSENSPHAVNTSISLLDEFLYIEKKEISNSEADYGSITSVHLPSETKSMEVNLATSIDFELDDLQTISPPILSSAPQKADKNDPVSKSPEKSITTLTLNDSPVMPLPISDESPLINVTSASSYLEDVLVLDVIPDDPDLFDISSEEERDFSVSCASNSENYASVSKPDIKPFIPKEKPSPDIKSIAHTQRIEHEEIETSNDFNTELSAVSVLTLPLTTPSTPSGTRYTDKRVVVTGHILGTSEQLRPNQGTDYQHHQKNITPLVKETSRWEKCKPEFSYYAPEIQRTLLPYGYCKFFFNTLKGCFRNQCSFLHVPKQSDEKICMDLLHKLLNENRAPLLRRAVWIFTQYYGQHLPRENYDKSILNALINPSLNTGCLPDVFQLLETASIANILDSFFKPADYSAQWWAPSIPYGLREKDLPPSVDLLIKVFQSVSSTGLNTAMSHLLDIFFKFVDLGLNLTSEAVGHIIATINPLTISPDHVNMLMALKSRFDMKTSNPTWTRDLATAIAEVEHCKVSSNWTKLGNLYLDVCRGCENITDLKNFSKCVADALMKDSDEERLEVPYSEFADTIIKNPPLSDLLKNILGRIGISVMSYYHRKQLWQKGRRVLCKLKELQINYTVLKGLAVQERVASRCHVVNIAVEIFLMCGNLISACKILKESDWIINTTAWPCERMDVLKRHNLLCALVKEALPKNMYAMCFDILQNLPGIQESQADITVSQYAVLFSNVLRSTVDNQCLGISSSIVDFMVTKKIPVEYVNLQQLITALGHSGMWPKARKHYKDALSFGFYAPFERNTDHTILHIPSFMSEVEMLITIEHFMVTNTSSLQSPGGSSQVLQIVLKRVEADKAQSDDSYRSAANRLQEAGRLSNPRLFLKHMTVNNTNEQVYILDHNAARKWLNENLKWAWIIWSKE